jgi:hypothetical protein
VQEENDGKRNGILKNQTLQINAPAWMRNWRRKILMMTKVFWKNNAQTLFLIAEVREQVLRWRSVGIKKILWNASLHGLR